MRLDFATYIPTNNPRASMERRSLRDLLETTRGDLWARAEYSGSEGCYIEVARWNFTTHRWECYAFEKVFGHELHPEWDAAKTAGHVARIINRRHGTEHVSVIHSLPAYTPERATP